VVPSRDREEIEHQLADLRARRDALLERRTAAHPDVVDIDERIAAITARLAAPTKSSPAYSQAPVVANVAAAVDHAAQEDLIMARNASQHAEKELASAEQADREAYDMLVKAQADRREVLSPAVVPPPPATQPLAPWLLAVIAGGLVLAGAAALCVRPSTIRTAADAQRVLRMPVVGILPSDLLRAYERTEPAA
jgi:hypothetical protein